MKWFLAAFAIAWASAVPASAAPLTTVAAVHNLTTSQAAQPLPVAFEANVAYARAKDQTLFVEDGDAGICVQASGNATFQPGDRIMVRGTTQPGLRPTVLANSITLLHHGAAKSRGLTVQQVIYFIGALLFLLTFIALKGWDSMQKVRRLSSSSAQFQKSLAKVLQDINGTGSTPEIIQQIIQLVSLKLRNASCWCEVAGEPCVGDWPSSDKKLRIIQRAIPAHSGPPLGILYAGMEPSTDSSPEEFEALAIGAGLATLAIETRRLHSDLVHRSEFDQLTNIHNRSALDKAMSRLLLETHGEQIFGLICFDLDNFRHLNDCHGHHIGDLFLQEAALCVKRQLRPSDVCARLGGDEFAVLVSSVRTRGDVEKIVHRLEHCFDIPFNIEGLVLRGSASFGIAIFPEDAQTADGLLSAADTAVNRSKNTKKTILQMPIAMG